jgi:hypothetical protein
MSVLHDKAWHSEEFTLFRIWLSWVWPPSKAYTYRALMAFFIAQIYVCVGNLLLGHHMVKADQFKFVDHSTFITT